MDTRLIVDAPASGAWNMAVDEALFQSAQDGSKTILRLYQWSEPTLSLGYFQRVQDRAGHARSRELTTVRRSTGGGAIVHDRELTYSLVTSLANERPAAARSLMVLVHESLVDLLHELKIPAQICGESQVGHPEPFLCFQRHTAGDILIGKDKVVGSAQRRQRRVLLQHGSILLDRSAAAPQLPGINDLSSKKCSVELLTEAWPMRLQELFAGSWETSELSTTERHLAEKIDKERFAADQWTFKR